jgi:eukaryotic-like serine/threonine-protein kinase
MARPTPSSSGLIEQAKELGTVGPADSWIVDPFLSPDEKRVAAGRGSTKHLLRDFDIWLLDLSRGNIASRFTFDPSAHYCPVWSPDGRHIIYASRPGVIGSASSLMEKPADGVGDEEALFRSDGDVAPLDWSTDGRYILFEKEDLKTKSDLWVLPTVGERKPISFLLTPFAEHAGVFSPDGHRIAYTSDESGRWEIYVRAFPTGGEKVRVSTGGGADPHWRRDGKELFYLAPDFKLMAVEVSTVSGFTAGEPKPLFETRVTGLADLRNHYVVTGDGQRFLVSSVTKEGATAPITVVLNWAADLRR